MLRGRPAPLKGSLASVGWKFASSLVSESSSSMLVSTGGSCGADMDPGQHSRPAFHSSILPNLLTAPPTCGGTLARPIGASQRPWYFCFLLHCFDGPPTRGGILVRSIGTNQCPLVLSAKNESPWVLWRLHALEARMEEHGRPTEAVPA